MFNRQKIIIPKEIKKILKSKTIFNRKLHRNLKTNFSKNHLLLKIMSTSLITQKRNKKRKINKKPRHKK